MLIWTMFALIREPVMQEQIAFSPVLLLLVAGVAVLGAVAFALYWFLGRGEEDQS
jgi:hypothetical protein